MSNWDPVSTFGAVVVGTLVCSWIYVRIKRRHYPTATEDDRHMWHWKAVAIGLGLLFYLMILSLPDSTWPTFIRDNDNTERKIEKVVEAQARESDRTEQLREILEVMLFVSVAALFTVAGFIGKKQRKREAELLGEDPEKKTQLGL